MMISEDHKMLARYERATKYEHAAFSERLVVNANVYPNWVGCENVFWYVKTTRGGKEFRLIDVDKSSNSRAFDHEALAHSLSVAIGISLDSANLPIALLKIDLEPRTVVFFAFERQWRFFEDTASCEELPGVPGSLSPDGEHTIFKRDHNLWVRHVEDGNERELTSNGELHYAYGTLPERVRLTDTIAELVGDNEVQGAWSPNSRYFLTFRTDERRVKSVPVARFAPRDGSVRPTCTFRRYGLPGDEHIAVYEMLIVDIQTGHVKFAERGTVPDAVLWASMFSGGRAWWSADSSKAYFIVTERHLKSARVVEFDVRSGETRILFEEVAETHLGFGFEFENPASLMPLPETDELIWWSERTGWAHIYLYDLKTGSLKNRITTGDWVVREVLHFDAERREVFVQVAGRDPKRNPYYRELVRVNVDTGALHVIASGDHDVIAHKSGTLVALLAESLGKTSCSLGSVSPTGNYVAVTFAKPDGPSVSKVLDRDGEQVMLIETADISGLPKEWIWPEPIKAIAADGQTDIYGLMFRPSDFDAEKQYPIIDIAFTNPFYAAVPHGAFGCDTMAGYYYMSAAALAELGFIVVIIDGRGSLYRSKAFHDHAYGRIELGSDLSDHVAWIKQIAEQRPYIDLNRVGIIDWGGSNGPIYGLLRHGDFYKVGAVAAVWDPRLIMHGDIYLGPDADNGRSAPGFAASDLEGKLLLVHGMLDDFFHPAGIFRLVDDLVRANKDFDLVILPNGGHAWNTNCYGTRRMWDHFVRYLADQEPPAGFKLMNGSEVAFLPQLDESVVSEDIMSSGM